MFMLYSRAIVTQLLHREAGSTPSDGGKVIRMAGGLDSGSTYLVQQSMAYARHPGKQIRTADVTVQPAYDVRSGS